MSYYNRSYEPIETTACISIEKYFKEKEEVPKIVITYSQGLRLIMVRNFFMFLFFAICFLFDFKELLNMFHNSQPTAQTNDLAAKVIAAGIFMGKTPICAIWGLILSRAGRNNAEIDFNLFLLEIKHQLEFVNSSLRVYYYSKFIDRGVKNLLKVPFMDSSSLILTEDLLSLFCLTCERFQKADELNLLYSMYDYMNSFESLATALKGYEGPTLILLKHDERDPKSGSKPQVHVLGGFTSTPWKDQEEYHGDSSGFVFSLIPKFKKVLSVIKWTQLSISQQQKRF